MARLSTVQHSTVLFHYNLVQAQCDWSYHSEADQDFLGVCSALCAPWTHVFYLYILYLQWLLTIPCSKNDHSNHKIICWLTSANTELQSRQSTKLQQLNSNDFNMLACVHNLNFRGIDFNVDGQVTFCSLLLASLPANVGDGAVCFMDIYWILILQKTELWGYCFKALLLQHSSNDTFFSLFGLFSEKSLTKASETAGGTWLHMKWVK